MKLLVVSQYFYPEPFRIGDVCFRLAEMGHEVTVLTGLPNYPMGEIFDGYAWEELRAAGKWNEALKACVEEISGVKVIRCNLRPRLSGKKNLALNYRSFWREGSKVAEALAADANYSFDKILVFQYSPVTMAMPAIRFQEEFQKRTGTKPPLYLYCFDLWPESIVAGGLPNRGPIYQGAKVLSKRIYAAADKLLISSKNFETYFNEKHGIYDNISYLPIYAEDIFCSSSIGDDSCSDLDSQTNSRGFNLVFAGNMGEIQSVDTILYAAKILQARRIENVHIHLVGDGSAYGFLNALKEDLELRNVTFHGRHPVEEMPKFYEMADAFLVTLKNDRFISYTLPGKVQSYLASGKPLIGAIGGETAQVIMESGCGLVCPARDLMGLADCIKAFAAATPKERREYGANAKRYYEENFSDDAFFPRLLEYLG